METKNRNNRGEMTLDGLAEKLEGLAEITQQGFKNAREEFKSENEKLRKEFKGENEKLAEMMQREFGRMDRKIDGLRSEMKEEINDLRHELREEIREKFDLVLIGYDKTIKGSEDQKTENIMSAKANRRHQDELDNHEERIGVVENKLKIAGAAG